MRLVRWRGARSRTSEDACGAAGRANSRHAHRGIAMICGPRVARIEYNYARVRIVGDMPLYGAPVLSVS